jgi:hypothetical protein
MAEDPGWRALSLAQLYLQVEGLSRAQDEAHTLYEEGRAEENDVQRRLHERVFGQIYRNSTIKWRRCREYLFRRIMGCSMAQLLAAARDEVTSPGLAEQCRGRITTRLFGIINMVRRYEEEGGLTPEFYATRVTEGGFDVKAACRDLDEWLADIARHYEQRFAGYTVWAVERARADIEPLRQAIEAFEHERAVAFMMRTHPRLGAASRHVEDEILRDIVAKGVHREYK